MYNEFKLEVHSIFKGSKGTSDKKKISIQDGCFHCMVAKSIWDEIPNVFNITLGLHYLSITRV